MILHCSAEEQQRLREYVADSEDCEQLSDAEAVLDLYDLDAPMTLDVMFRKDGLQIDGAYYLAYSEELDGWYMERPVEHPADVRGAFVLANIWTN